MVSTENQYANWSLWQKQEGKRVPLGFLSRKLPSTKQPYTQFEQELLAAYWALSETEFLTLGHEVIIRPQMPIMQWVLSDPVSHKIGHAQEANIIK